MKYLFALIVLVISQSVNLETTRNAYKYAAQDTSKVKAFFKNLERVTKSDKLELVAYKGASIALMAKEAKTIKEKKERFVKGVSLVEYAIEKDSNNIEVRFVRLSIQQNVPKILKYHSDIKSDKKIILENYSNIKNTSLKRHLSDYISHSKGFTDEEKIGLMRN
ncbi:hypothetical protein KO493_11245 [Tamlana agarivorans]|uniref:Uncharacterized protein n=1 Tax=Pseudotamlana agarivorans TaxID=481183 RepID=A0ACC5UAA2_9FLAO|nr:hypothetical protein [Tamlana agarivorans]MBU2951273.1 hypothetical protein [Tamlana agarivorans]